MNPTTPRARNGLAYKYLTLSIRGRIIKRRRRGVSYREIVFFKKIPKSITFNII